MKNLRYLFFLVLICLMGALFCACTEEITEKQVDYGEANQNLAENVEFAWLEEKPEGISVAEYEIELEDRWEIGSIAEAGNTIFCISYRRAELFERLDECKILRVNTETGNVSQEILLDTGGFSHANELVGTAEDLFWVELGKTWRIKKYNLQSKEVSTIKESEDISQTILLAAGANYISWYEMLPNDKTALYIYDVTLGEIREISSDTVLVSPFSRAMIQGALLTYATKEGGEYVANVFDLDKGEIIAQVNMGENYPSDLMGNDKYIIWCADPFYEEADLYAYDFASGKTLKINDRNSPLSVFSYHLLNDLILINDMESKNILAFDVDGGGKWNITDSLGAEHHYYLGNVTQSNAFIACEDDVEPPKIVRITQN